MLLWISVVLDNDFELAATGWARRPLGKECGHMRLPVVDDVLVGNGGKGDSIACKTCRVSNQPWFRLQILVILK
jgi:hypothetical protein